MGSAGGVWDWQRAHLLECLLIMHEALGLSPSNALTGRDSVSPFSAGIQEVEAQEAQKLRLSISDSEVSLVYRRTCRGGGGKRACLIDK